MDADEEVGVEGGGWKVMCILHLSVWSVRTEYYT